MESSKQRKENEEAERLAIGSPIQCVVSYRDQCAHKHTAYIII